MDHDSDAIRYSAIWTLGVLGRKVEALLLEALNESDGRMEDGIRRTLARLDTRANH